MSKKYIRVDGTLVEVTLLNKGLVMLGRYTQETGAGILNVEVKEDTAIFMSQSSPKFCEIVDANEIADSLNTSVNNIRTDMPVQIVTTGLRDIMFPIKSIDVLDSLYHSNAYCRNFAPLYGIPEESATGTSNGALACYLLKQGIVKI